MDLANTRIELPACVWSSFQRAVYSDVLCRIQHELEKIQSLLEQFEMDMIERDSQAENIVAEVNELRSHVLKLRFQLDVVDTSSTMDAIQSDWVTLSPSSHELT